MQTPPVANGLSPSSQCRVRESRNARLAASSLDGTNSPRQNFLQQPHHHHRHQQHRRPRSNSVPIQNNNNSITSSVAPRSNVGSASPSRNRSLLATAMDAIAHSPDATSIMDTNSLTMRRAAKELMGIQRMRSRWSIVDPRTSSDNDGGEYWVQPDGDDNGNLDVNNNNNNIILQDDRKEDQEEMTSLLMEQSQKSSASNGYGSTTVLEEGLFSKTTTGLPMIPTLDQNRPQGLNRSTRPTNTSQRKQRSNNKTPLAQNLEHFLQQVSSVAVVALLNIMIAIPFGASYFPVGWRAVDASTTTTEEDYGNEDADDLHGDFPLAGKQALGIRMFLFATLMGQLAFTFASKFKNPVGLQMVENVPFLHALCHTVVQQQGYGIHALSTVFFLFGLSSVIVGLVFYCLGKCQLGRVVYFFPNHVLVGCIGGIGVFIIITSVEVTNEVTFTFDVAGWGAFVDNFHLFVVVLGFESFLRGLSWATQDKQGRPQYPLLSPIYYCLITPVFYLGLHLLGISMERATGLGYFFPSSSGGGDSDGDATTSIWSDPHLWDIFSVIDLSTVSWTAVLHSTGTVIALAAFSLIHVPINIPAFAISTDVGESDSNIVVVVHIFLPVGAPSRQL
jgi:hypothetical protein